MNVSVEQIEEYIAYFEALREQQWHKGADEYGNAAFVELDDDKMLQMFLEELADIANYAMMTSVRMMLWRDHFAGGTDSSDVPTVRRPEDQDAPSPPAFVGKHSVPGFFQPSGGAQDPG